MKRPHLSNYALVQIACWCGYAGISVLALLPATPAERIPRLLLIKGSRALLGLPLSHLLRGAYVALMRRGVRPAGMVVAALLAAAVTGPVWMLLSRLVLGIVEQPAPIDWRALPHNSLDMSIAMLGWSAAYFGWRYWRSAEAAVRDAEAARVLATSAQLEALRYQLNPHFLFNALASVRGCMLEDTARAREMITQLSDVLRFTLRSASAQTVAFSDEIDALRSYLAIEKARYEESLEIRIDVESAANDVEVPVFLLHPLVENAVVHGRRNARGVLQIEIDASLDQNGLTVVITNTGTLTKDKTRFTVDRAGSGGIGLRNVRERLLHCYGANAELEVREENGRVYAAVRMPVSAYAGAEASYAS